jgi:hypothetical protein
VKLSCHDKHKLFNSLYFTLVFLSSQTGRHFDYLSRRSSSYATLHALALGDMILRESYPYVIRTLLAHHNSPKRDFGECYIADTVQ